MAIVCSLTRIAFASLRNGLQPLLSDEREQLERGAARVFLAALPLADEPGGDVKIAREYRLARLLTHTDLPDLFGRKVLDWCQAYLVEFLHRLLTNDARLIKASRPIHIICNSLNPVPWV